MPLFMFILSVFKYCVDEQLQLATWMSLISDHEYCLIHLWFGVFCHLVRCVMTVSFALILHSRCTGQHYTKPVWLHYKKVIKNNSHLFLFFYISPFGVFSIKAAGFKRKTVISPQLYSCQICRRLQSLAGWFDPVLLSWTTNPDVGCFLTASLVPSWGAHKNVNFPVL